MDIFCIYQMIKINQRSKSIAMNTVIDVFDDNEDSVTTNAANLRAITMSQLMTKFEKYGAKFDTNDQA